MDEIVALNVLQNLDLVEQIENNHDRDFWSHWGNSDPFQSMTDAKFIKYFRLPKELVHNLIEELDEFLVAPSRQSSLSKRMKILLALKFYASGSYQTDIGSCKYLAVSQSSVSRCIKEVTSALNQHRVFNRWVRFPQNLEELRNVRREFYNTFGIPGIVGVIDCTHVAIYPPDINNDIHPEYIYINRKNYHSINAQLVCDINLKIMNVNALFPGSTHDSHIWNSSSLNRLLQDINRHDDLFFLIGDSGYPLRRWLQTPIRHVEPGTPEYQYNEAFRTCRNTIERCIGVLKQRFRCLLKHRVLHYKPTVASQIINACTVLHNICISNNVPLLDRGDEVLDYGIINNDFAEIVAGRNGDLENGRRVQQQIIRSHFV